MQLERNNIYLGLLRFSLEDGVYDIRKVVYYLTEDGKAHDIFYDSFDYDIYEEGKNDFDNYLIIQSLCLDNILKELGFEDKIESGRLPAIYYLLLRDDRLIKNFPFFLGYEKVKDKYILTDENSASNDFFDLATMSQQSSKVCKEEKKDHLIKKRIRNII